MEKPREAPLKNTRTICLNGQDKLSVGDTSSDSIEKFATATNRTTAVPVVTGEDEPEHNDWVLKTKRRKKPPRPDAMIILGTGYKVIMRKLNCFKPPARNSMQSRMK